MKGGSQLSKSMKGESQLSQDVAGDGWALIISEHDHRPGTIAEKLRRLTAGTKLASGARIVSATRLRQLFGVRPYHILVRLEGTQEQLVEAFEYLEENFSHVDGFEPVMGEGG